MEEFTLDGNKLRYLAISKQITDSVDPNFKTPEGFLIPLKKSVVIKKQGATEAMTTENGIIIPEIAAANTNIPNIGIVYAVGPEVDVLLQPGQRVYFNQYANLEVLIKGNIYIMISEHDVYGVLPDKAWVSIDNKTEKQVRQEKKLNQLGDFLQKKHVKDQNELDLKSELSKKKR